MLILLTYIGLLCQAEQKKLLIQFLDAEEHFRGEEKIDAFCSGFQLADGIHRELGEAYSYEAEDEARAREIFRRELEKNGQS